jgi:hypothetical protein
MSTGSQDWPMGLQNVQKDKSMGMKTHLGKEDKKHQNTRKRESKHIVIS